MAEPPIQGLRPHEAMEILRRDPSAILLDVRGRVEYEYVGHPLGALNVPWMDVPDWKPDPDFASKVRQALRDRNLDGVEARPILTLCRSGKRSLAAAQELARHGFTQLYNIMEGFEGERDANGHRSTLNGWRYHGLPWEQG